MLSWQGDEPSGAKELVAAGMGELILKALVLEGLCNPNPNATRAVDMVPCLQHPTQ